MAAVKPTLIIAVNVNSLPLFTRYLFNQIVQRRRRSFSLWKCFPIWLTSLWPYLGFLFKYMEVIYGIHFTILTSTHHIIRNPKMVGYIICFNSFSEYSACPLWRQHKIIIQYSSAYCAHFLFTYGSALHIHRKHCKIPRLLQ